ncbi:MAG: hypothetical protein ACTSWN_17320 [Promethearchaeota archaeon]
MSYIPKYILKRIIPKDALKNVDINGDGNIDGVMLTYVNVLAPMKIEEDFDEDDLKKQFEDADILIDGKKQDINSMALYMRGRRITTQNIADLRGIEVPVGGKIFIYCPMPGGLDAGSHVLKIKTVYRDQVNEIELKRELADQPFSLSELEI